MISGEMSFQQKVRFYRDEILAGAGPDPDSERIECSCLSIVLDRPEFEDGGHGEEFEALAEAESLLLSLYTSSITKAYKTVFSI
jgi:hypothetical protein